jgi:ribosomal protein S18 acetylase RimI-like enzyme
VPDDAAACIDLRGRTRQNAVSAARLAAVGITEASWAEEVRTHKLPGYVCSVDDKMVGYCFGDAETGEVVVLALLPEYEDQGIGKELLRLAMSGLRSRGHERLFLGCSDDPATRSYGFYRHLGWRSTGVMDSNGDEVLEYFFEATRQA